MAIPPAWKTSLRLSVASNLFVVGRVMWVLLWKSSSCRRTRPRVRLGGCGLRFLNPPEVPLCPRGMLFSSNVAPQGGMRGILKIVHRPPLCSFSNKRGRRRARRRYSYPLVQIGPATPVNQGASSKPGLGRFLSPGKVFLRDQRRHSSEIRDDLVLHNGAHQQVCLRWSQFVFARQPLDHI